MQTQSIGYGCNGVQMAGYLADGSCGRPAPGILIAHEAGGLGDHVRERADALASEGYVALALDLYGDDAVAKADVTQKYERMMSTPGLMVKRARAGLRTLAEQPTVDAGRLGVIGFCLGGIVALELARHQAPVRCVVGFHPAFARPVGSPEGPIHPQILMMVGGDDPFVAANDRDAFAASMEKSGADWQLHLFGGVGHSFTNPAVDALGLPGLKYDRQADRRSWRMMMDLFRDVFELDQNPAPSYAVATIR